MFPRTTSPKSLTDAFLGRCLPFYIGAPNASDYFPSASFIPLDINDPAGAAAIIRKAIADDEWSRRRDAIEKARRQTLENHHLFAVIAHIIDESVPTIAAPATSTGKIILGRHAWRRNNRLGAAGHMLEKLYVRGRSLLEKTR